MTVKYGFYDSLNGDRTYNANDVSTMFEGIFSDGIFPSVGNSLEVVNDPGTMNILVKDGRAWFNHLWIRNTNTLSLPLEPSHMIYDRIDVIVLEFNSEITVRENSIKILTGVPAVTPIPSVLANTSTLKQYALAHVRVNALVSEILVSDITDKRGSVNTPYAGYILSSLPPINQEEVQDIVGAMVSGNTETGITVSYDDPTGKLNFSVSSLSPEEVEDIVGAMVSGNSETGITVTYDDSSGKLNFSVTGGVSRELLTADRTYYVRTDGNNNNTGLLNTAGGAFLTIQKAIDVVATLDISVYNVTIQIADGTYVSGDVICKNPVGSGNVIIQGNNSTPANVVVDGGFQKLSPGTTYVIKDLRLIKSSSSSTSAIYSLNGAYIEVTNLVIGSGYVDQIYSDVNGVIAITGNYTINGGASRHLRASQGGTVRNTVALTCTLTGTPAFSVQFVTASQIALVRMASVTYSGAATGKRYTSDANAVINTGGGGGANYFPGSVAGSVSNGGIYL